MPTHAVLLITRRQSLIAELQGSLNPDRYTLRWSASTARALATKMRRPHLVVLDLPGSSGSRVSQRLKARFGVPLLVLIPKGATPPPLADASLAYRCSVHELAAAIPSLLVPESSSVLSAAGLRLDSRSRKLEIDGTQHSLSPRLCDLLSLMMHHAGELLSRERLVREVWRTDFVDNTRMLDGQISRLRRLVERDPRHPRRLLTVWGKGYVLRHQDSHDATGAS